MFVNVVGALLMGMLAELLLMKGDLAKSSSVPDDRLLGGFTTFRLSVLRTVDVAAGDYGTLAAYVIGSVVLSIAALLLGMGAVRPIA